MIEPPSFLTRSISSQRLALLLTQMADALASLIDKSQEATAQNANQDGEEQEPIAMGDYEDLLQDWLASVHVSPLPGRNYSVPMNV